MRVGPPALLLLLLFPAVAGCLDAPGEVAPAAAAAADALPAVDPWGGAQRARLVHRDGAATEMDLACAFGGGMEMQREADGRVHPGAARVEVTIRQSPTWRGSQVGFSIDGGEVTWLAPAWTDEATYAIEAAPDLAERDARRWTFHWQLNLPEPATRDCYTGAATGEVEVLIEAVKG